MAEQSGVDDPLLGCLLLLNRALHRAVPSAVLLDGPKPEVQCLTLSQLPAAAARAGLSIEPVKLELDDIPDPMLPAILLLDRSRACVLLRRLEHGRVLVALPGWGGGEQEVSSQELLAQYTGHALLALPTLGVEVSADTAQAQPRQSLSAAIRQSWPRNGRALVAAMLRRLCLRGRQPPEGATSVS
ncbi:cysteine peptidase family C39 domain-containing protein [Cupriavidus necator]